MGIISLADLKSYSGITDMDDDKAQAVVNGVNQWVNDYTGRFFGSVVELTEVFDYAPAIFLHHIDITEVESVKVYGQEIVENTLVNRQTGRLVISRGGYDLNISRKGYDAIEVKYKSGVETVPVDLKMATLQLAMDNYNRKDGKDAGITATSIGGYSVAYGNAVSTSSAQANATSGQQSSMTDYMAVFNFYRVRSL